MRSKIRSAREPLIMEVGNKGISLVFPDENVKYDLSIRRASDVRGLLDEIAKKKMSKDDIKKKIRSIKTKDEVEEIVNTDGSMINSDIPVLDSKLHPRKTTDQSIPATRQTNDPIMRGYRTYYNEGEMTESDFSDAFGYEETKDMNGKDTKRQLEKMGIGPEEAADRTKQFGKDPTGKRTQKSKYRNKKGFIDKMTLTEKKREMAEKMVEDILTNRSRDGEITPKDDDIENKLIKKNIRSLVKMAKRNNVSIKQIMRMIRNEQ